MSFYVEMHVFVLLSFALLPPLVAAMTSSVCCAWLQWHHHTCKF